MEVGGADSDCVCAWEVVLVEDASCGFELVGGYVSVESGWEAWAAEGDVSSVLWCWRGAGSGSASSESCSGEEAECAV